MSLMSYRRKGICLQRITISLLCSYQCNLSTFPFILSSKNRGWAWEYLATGEPYSYHSPRYDVEMNTILRYYITTVFIFGVGMLQWGLRKFVSFRYPTDIQEFTYLLPVANISIIILGVQGPQHGFYIHGKAANTRAEGTAEDLKKYLLAESQASSRSRGLVASDTLQTFEIFVSKEMREIYDT